MFRNPFSFDGRIGRTEYGISLFIYSLVVAIFFLNMRAAADPEEASVFGLIFLPAMWFLWAQAIKRCHDMGKSGWWIVIPYYVFWMIFRGGQVGENEYGNNPKQELSNLS